MCLDSACTAHFVQSAAEVLGKSNENITVTSLTIAWEFGENFETLEETNQNNPQSRTKLSVGGGPPPGQPARPFQLDEYT
jgi:hypothetical protein